MAEDEEACNNCLCNSCYNDCLRCNCCNHKIGVKNCKDYDERDLEAEVDWYFEDGERK